MKFGNHGTFSNIGKAGMYHPWQFNAGLPYSFSLLDPIWDKAIIIIKHRYKSIAIIISDSYWNQAKHQLCCQKRKVQHETYFYAFYVSYCDFSV